MMEIQAQCVVLNTQRLRGFLNRNAGGNAHRADPSFPLYHWRYHEWDPVE